MQSTDIEVIKEIPGYKVILKAVLKSQIQHMVEQLADHTGEESVILTASVSDGSLSHLGSESGKVFLQDHDDIKSQFLGFCLKRHHTQKQIETQQQRLLDTEAGIISAAPTLTRMAPGRRPRFASTHTPPSPSLQMPMQFQNTPHYSPHSSPHYSSSPQDIHPVALTQSRGINNVRREPYPLKRPRKRQERPNSINQESGSMKLPTETGTVINDNFNTSDVTVKMEAADSQGVHGSENSENSSEIGEKTVDQNQKSSSPQSLLFSQSSISKDDESNSSASTIVNEAVGNNKAVNCEGVNIDTGKSDNTDSVSQGNISDIDPAANIKVETITESELELEITGIEPGHMSISDNNWTPGVPAGMEFGQSYLGQGRRASTGSERNQDFDKQNSAERGLTHINPTWQDPCDKITRFECDVCGKYFSKKWNLESHHRTHTGVKLFQCDVCLKTFSWKGNLRRHIFLTHRKPENVNLWNV